MIGKDHLQSDVIHSWKIIFSIYHVPAIMIVPGDSEMNAAGSLFSKILYSLVEKNEYMHEELERYCV